MRVASRLHLSLGYAPPSPPSVDIPVFKQHDVSHVVLPFDELKVWFSYTEFIQRFFSLMNDEVNKVIPTYMIKLGTSSHGHLHLSTKFLSTLRSNTRLEIVESCGAMTFIQTLYLVKCWAYPHWNLSLRPHQAHPTRMGATCWGTWHHAAVWAPT